MHSALTQCFNTGKLEFSLNTCKIIPRLEFEKHSIYYSIKYQFQFYYYMNSQVSIFKIRFICQKVLLFLPKCSVTKVAIYVSTVVNTDFVIFYSEDTHNNLYKILVLFAVTNKFSHTELHTLTIISKVVPLLSMKHLQNLLYSVQNG